MSVTTQSAFDFAPGLTAQFPRLRDVVSAAVYNSRSGLKGCASDLDVSPSILSRMLSRDQDDPRRLDVDELVTIVESTGDVRPVQWLIERFLQTPEARRATAVSQLAALMPCIIELAQQAGITATAAKAKR